MAVDYLKDLQHLWIRIIITIHIKSFILIDLVNQNFQFHLVQIRLHGLYSFSFTHRIKPQSPYSSDYDAYSNYRADPYAAPLRPDLAVAYQQQQQQHAAYPPPNQPRQQHAYGNAPNGPGPSYAAAPLGQYYGTQQRA